MLTSLHIKNFKKLKDVTIELGKNVVLIGPNNSGKTTALQALALWEIGLKKWNEKWKGKTPERPGVTVNRRDLFSIPIPYANLLWHGTHVRKLSTQNIRIEITVSGITDGKEWSCGLEFDYANDESFYCRPLRISGEETKRMPIPDEAAEVRVVFLPPMSGLVADEPKWEQGRIHYLLGQGQTAQVLRNLCLQVYEQDLAGWARLTDMMKQLFGVTINPPEQTLTGGISMSYSEYKVELDLSSAGRGLQQILLLFAYLLASPKTVLLLDEPDAHLEVLRQRQIYSLMVEIAETTGSQIVAASHSEVVLNEAAQRDTVIAFIGNRPHRIDDRGNQLLKSLREIPFDHYYQAEQTGWVLYLEGSTDLSILQQLAKTLGHPAARLLERPFVHYIGNQLSRAREHFYGLAEAKPDLIGIAIIDRTDIRMQPGNQLVEQMWTKREIENYICKPEILLAYSRDGLRDDLFGRNEINLREETMAQSIQEMTAALRISRKPDPWSSDIKATDDFLDPLFSNYFEKLGLPNLMRKTDYHVLAKFIDLASIDTEITQKLDAIAEVATKAIVPESE